MSVSLFGDAEVGHLYRMALFVVTAHPSLRQVVENSKPYARYRKRELGPVLPADVFLQEVLARLFHYLNVANKVAYILMYQEEDGKHLLHEQEDWPDAPIPCSPAKFRSRLDELDYNLYTNDGNRFLDDEWHDIVTGLLQAIGALPSKERFTDPAKDKPA